MKTPVWVVKSVVPQENDTLLLTFADGKKRLYDATPLLDCPAFQPLRDDSVFKAAKVERGVVVWLDGEIDIAPEHLYENSVPVQ